VPVTYPLRFHEEKKLRDEQAKITKGTKMQCRNWTCGKAYNFNEKPAKNENNCRFHPG